MEARKLKTVDELDRYSEQDRVELIGGRIVERALPRPKHGFAQASTAISLGPFCSGGSIGGWLILTEIDVLYDEHNCPTHDLAGWRRERLPGLPDTTITTTPDWVCEILSPGHERKDAIDMLVLLQRHAVPYYWLISPESKTIIAYRLVDGKYAIIATAEENEKIRIEPFAGTEIDLDLLFNP